MNAAADQGAWAPATLDDDGLLDAFERCTLPAPSLDHALHVRLAWIYLRNCSLLEALGRFSGALKRYTRAIGEPGKYHETVTWAYIIVIHERMHDNPGCDWLAFARNNQDLFARHPSLLEQWYRPETLRTERARRMFLMPDGPNRRRSIRAGA